MISANYLKLFAIFIFLINLNLLASEEKTDNKNWLKNINNNLSLTLEGSLSSNFYKPDSTKKSFDSSLLFYPRFKFTNSITGLLYLTFDKELINYREDDWGTSFLGASFKIAKFGKDKMFKLKLATKAYLPLDEQNRKNYQMRTKLVLGPKLKTDLSKIVLKNLSFTYGIDFGRYIHKYKTARDGSSLSEYSITQKFIAEYMATDSISMISLFYLTDRWSYSGKRKTSSYLFDTSITYQLTDVIYGSLGYSNTTKAFKPDGTTNNVDIFNTRYSTSYISIGMEF